MDGSEDVISVPGTWVETPLATPVQLVGGTTCRVGVYLENDGHARFWTSIVPDPVIIGNRNRVTNDISGAARFCRLRKMNSLCALAEIQSMNAPNPKRPESCL